MDRLERELAEWRATPPRDLPLSKVEIDPALQPRDERLVSFRDRPRADAASQDHIDRMRHHLEANTGHTVEPVLVADVEGTLYLVDGHHRLRAHKLARRRQVPARVRRMTRERAVLLSKLVNLDGVKLPMHAEQRRDAAWQYLAEVTMRGRLPLPEGESQRTVRARFGIGSKDTIGAMLRKLPKVNPTDYPSDACDPGTGWPRWRHARGSGAPIDEWLAKLDPEQRTEREAERIAGKLAKLRDKADPEAWRRALHLLAKDAKADRDDSEAVRALLESEDEGSDF